MRKLESILKKQQVIRFDDLSPFSPVYLGGQKVAFNEAYVIEVDTLVKHPVKMGNGNTVQAWRTPEPTYLTLPTGGDGVVLIITHSSRPDTPKTEQLEILEAEIKSSTDQQADAAGDPQYPDTHTILQVCNVSINNGIAKFTEKLNSNVYVLFYGEKEE